MMQLILAMVTSLSPECLSVVFSLSLPGLLPLQGKYSYNSIWYISQYFLPVVLQIFVYGDIHDKEGNERYYPMKQEIQVNDVNVSIVDILPM